ncbi:MAG: leucine-rich repeat domain-containing protein [Deltaproteobacteria bacterium]|nr:leucine-rich repeat domain-containing protein [Deltaproteobacteria bacterium]
MLAALLDRGGVVAAAAQAFAAAPERATYQALVAALRDTPAPDRHDQALQALSFAVAQRWPRLALGALLPQAGEPTLDRLLGEADLALEQQPPSPSKMVFTQAALELRIAPHGTTLKCWRPAAAALTDTVVRAAGQALTGLSFGWEVGGTSWLDALRGVDRAVLRHLDADHLDAATVHALLAGAVALEGLSVMADALDDGLDLPALRWLEISAGSLVAPAAVALGRCPRLAHVSMRGAVSRDTLLALTALPALTELAAWDSRCGDEGAAVLARRSTLRSLWLPWADISDAGAAALAALSELRELGLDRNRVGDVGAMALAALPELERLYLANNQIGPAGALAIARMPKLCKLDLGNNRIDDAGARARAALPTQCALTLVGNPIIDVDGVRLALTSTTQRTNLVLDDEDAYWARVP